MFLVVYVPNFARRWQLTGDSVVILNGDAERTVIPWQSVKSITVRGFGLLLVTTQRKKHRLFGLLRDDAESIVRAWRQAMNR